MKVKKKMAAAVREASTAANVLTAKSRLQSVSRVIGVADKVIKEADVSQRKKVNAVNEPWRAESWLQTSGTAKVVADALLEPLLEEAEQLDRHTHVHRASAVARACPTIETRPFSGAKMAQKRSSLGAVSL